MTAQTDDIEYDDNDVTDSDTDTDTDPDEWTPPTREEWEELRAKKAKADSEAASRKRWLRELGYDPKTGQKVSTSDDSAEILRSEPAVDIRKIESGISRKLEAVYAGLAQAGVPAGQLGRLARFIDTSAVEVDEDGTEGLTNQIESLKADYPELFKRPRAKATDAAVVGGGKKAPAKATESRSWEDEVRARFNAGLF